MRVLKELTWFFNKEKKAYLLGLTSLLIISILNLLPAKILGFLVDEINIKTLTPKILIVSILTYVSIAFVVYGLRYIWRVYIFGTSFRLETSLRNTIFKHLTRMSSSFYQQNRSGELMALATNDLKAIQAVAGQGILQLFDSMFSGLTILLAMFFTVSWKLTLLSLLPMVLLVISSQFLSKQLHKTFHVSQQAFANMNNRVLENINGIKVTKAFGQEKKELNRFDHVTNDVYQKNLAVNKWDAMFDPVITFIISLAIVVTILFGSHLVINNQISPGDFITFMNYIYQLTWPMMAIGFMYNTFNRGLVSYERINELLSVSPDVRNQSGSLKEIPKGNIDFNISNFQYPNQKGDDSHLSHVSFSLKQGETLGIVGKTGSGKSTIIKLLLREFEEYQGYIKFGNTLANNYNLYSYRDGFGYVPQDPFLFSMTILDNIRFGMPEATLEEVRKVAQIADVDEDIMDFELKYDTIVGERGVSLSGGQKQRIAMARAMLLNPECLILDDALSAVDARTEEIILENLRKIRNDKTTIIVAHRFSALKHAQHIIVLDQGEIIEEGNHECLVDQGNWYSEIYKLQQFSKDV